MSEYQYYEFQAVDRPLTRAEMDELRAISSRATITPNLLRNVYNYGDFRGDPERLVEMYFDAFLYEANWGTRQLLLRLPRRLLDPAEARPYCVDDILDVRLAGEFVVADFHVGDEEGGGWIDQSDSEAWLPALLPLRTELASGDFRSLYLGWLAAVGKGVLDETDDEVSDFDGEADDETEVEDDGEASDQLEPPVPPGLANLSAPLQTLAEFLGIDPHLLVVAAERSAPLSDMTPTSREAERWIVGLAESEKDALLLRVMNEGGQHLQAELRQRFRVEGSRSLGPALSARESDERRAPRTVRQLLVAAEERAKAEKRARAERDATERARRQREEAIARSKHLHELAGREEELWRRIDDLVEVKRAAEYDQAIQLLKDLRDLAARAGTTSAFRARASDLRARNTRKPSFVARMDGAGIA